MNIKPLVVKSYLESLTEENELNRIFPILLSSLKFEILSKPTYNKGLPEYGKDIVAVGFENGIKKRFYYELKGGGDRNITTTNLHKKDGIIESIREAKYKKFATDYPNFEKLPLKIVIVHNGILKGSAREVFDGFIKSEFEFENIDFERFDIERLTSEFSDHLFGAFLLTNQENTKLFNKVLINLNTSEHVSFDYIKLVDNLFSKEWKGYKSKLPRQWVLLFETLKLIAFIIYTEAKEYNNLDICKRYIASLVIKFWFWILKNKLERDRKVINYFNQVFFFYISVLGEYFRRTLPIAKIFNGLSSEKSGRYEQIGYTKRTFEYLQYLCFYIDVEMELDEKFDAESAKSILTMVINNNSVSSRPLIDINSIPIIEIVNIYLRLNDKLSASNYLKSVFSYLKNGKKKYNRMPDANNSYESMIRFTVTGKKSAYYSETTSPLLSTLLEYTVILDLETLYLDIRDFVTEYNIDLGLFTPHHGVNSNSKHLIENTNLDLEEQLFSIPDFSDGYQRAIDVSENLEFKKFKKNLIEIKEEYQYEYRTDLAGFSPLRNLAHIYFKIPFFPDKWRGKLIE